VSKSWFRDLFVQFKTCSEGEIGGDEPGLIQVFFALGEGTDSVVELQALSEEEGNDVLQEELDGNGDGI